jgi:hypothetical protein
MTHLRLFQNFSLGTALLIYFIRLDILMAKGEHYKQIDNLAIKGGVLDPLTNKGVYYSGIYAVD